MPKWIFQKTSGDQQGDCVVTQSGMKRTEFELTGPNLTERLYVQKKLPYIQKLL
jgi:hypothetical protein